MEQISRPFRPLVIAHRGACRHASENSAEAIRLSAELGADWVEVDVRITSDGALVLVHDDRVQALDVAGSTLGELRKEWAPLATLEEGLEAAGGIGVNLELKAPVADPEDLVSKVGEKTAGFQGPLLISSFFLPILAAAAEAIPGVDIGVLTGHRYDLDGRLAISSALDGGYGVALPEASVVGAELIVDAHSAGLRIITWTVNREERIRELAVWGIDGIITDEPDRARAVLDSPVIKT